MEVDLGREGRDNDGGKDIRRNSQSDNINGWTEKV